MRRKPIKYTAGEIGRARAVEDFLPPSETLLPRDDKPKKSSSKGATST